MISESVLAKLSKLEGFLTKNEGQRLAELAMAVPKEHAIVEVGSFKGKSACFLGMGSRMGESAPVYAVDLWDLNPDPQYASPAIYRRWHEQIAQMNLKGFVTPIRYDSSIASEIFSDPIGVLFIDGDHDHESVARDFLAWSPKVVPGGIVAFHDYRKARFLEGVTKFVDEQVATSDQWSLEEAVDSLLIVRRGEARLRSEDRLTFVDNSELESHLAKRPAQYAFDLAPIVRKRDDAGIYLDTFDLQYRELQDKYSTVKNPVKPLESRVRSLCQACPVGARCKFPRLSFKERTSILNSNNPSQWQQWCETKAWGGETDIIYPYVGHLAQGEELRFSLRSLEKNFVGTPKVWIVGDRPDWYQGNHIPHQQLEHRRYLPRFDQVAKARKILKERKIGQEFLWMMDDVYFLNPITLEELRTPRMRGNFHLKKLSTYLPENDWQRSKKLTWEVLAKEGRPVDDMGAHLPYYYEKPKLRALLKKYRLDQNPYVINLLYFNVYPTFLPRQSHEILRRDQGDGTTQEILDRCQDALILNHPDHGYTPAMEDALTKLFPNPSRFERAGIGDPSSK